LRGTNGEALGDDLAGEPAAAFVVRDGENRARVTVGQLAPLDHAEHVLGQLEQADPVGDRRVRTAHALADLAEAEPELVDQERISPRLLDRGELLARDVLDDAEQERVPVVGLPDERRNRRRAGLLRGTPKASQTRTQGALVARGYGRD